MARGCGANVRDACPSLAIPISGVGYLNSFRGAFGIGFTGADPESRGSLGKVTDNVGRLRRNIGIAKEPSVEQMHYS